MHCLSGLQYSLRTMPFPAAVVLASYTPPNGIRDSIAPAVGSASKFSRS
jgi:hypothetical protein